MSALVSGLIGGACAVIVCALAGRTQKAGRIDGSGWKHLTPNWLARATLIGCAFFVALPAYILLSGGSQRPDAEEQNFYAFLLMLGSGLGGIYHGWVIYGHAITWKDDEFWVQTLLGRKNKYKFSDVSSISESDMLGEYRLNFPDGSKIRISTCMHGSRELISQLQLSHDDI